MGGINLHTQNNWNMYEQQPVANQQQNNWNTYEQQPVTNQNPHLGLLNTVQDCAVTCEEMTTMLHESENLYNRGIQLSHLRDCADICALMVKYLARSSHFSKALAGFCAYVCEICGNTCLQFPDQESQRCGHICLGCAKECKQFAGTR